MLKSNLDDLVMMGVSSFVTSPKLVGPPYRADQDGMSTISIGMAGIVYNVKVGDPAYGWFGDHIEPGVSVAHPDLDVDYALHYLMCVGNEAVVTSGLAAGSRGVVTGEHARVIVHFDEGTLDLLTIGDRILIKTFGRGMKIIDCPGIMVKKAGPNLIEKWGLKVLPGGRLQVPVVASMPAELLGSGSELTPEFVDHDMMSADQDALREHGVDNLRLGDLVAVIGTDHRYGRGNLPGGVMIGLIMHGDCIQSGHGPGCQEMLICVNGEIEPIIDADANIGKMLGIR